MVSFGQLVLEPKGDAPASRVRRGFWRIGIACGVIMLIFVAALSFNSAKQSAEYADKQYENLQCIKSKFGVNTPDEKYKKYEIDVKFWGCGNYETISFEELDDKNIRELYKIKNSFFQSLLFGLLIAIVTGLIVHFSFVFFGWMVSGFFRGRE